jgi:hypothetical protein
MRPTPSTQPSPGSGVLPRELPDRIVRRTLAVPENLPDFLRDASPQVAEGFDYSRMQPVNREMFTDDWRFREADLLFEIPFLDSTLDVPALVCVLIEHQSDVDRMVPLRMLFTATGYWERRWHAWQRLPTPRPRFDLPPILPIVLYTGEQPWGSATSIRDLLGGPEAFHPFAPGWQPVFWSLESRTPEQLLNGGAFLQVLAVMRVTWREQAEFERVFAEAMRRLQALHGREEVRWHELLEFALKFALWRRPSDERQRLVEIASETNPGREREVRVMTQTIAEGYLNEGRILEAQAALRSILEDRFGQLPEAMSQTIVTMSDLERLREARRLAVRVSQLSEFQM